MGLCVLKLDWFPQVVVLEAFTFSLERVLSSVRTVSFLFSSSDAFSFFFLPECSR